MYRIAVLGDRDSIYGFASLGLDIFPVSDSETGARTELERYREAPLPAVIPIPGVRGNTGMGIRMVKKSVEQAVGSDIIFNEK